MSLVLAAGDVAELAVKIRSRIAGGAPVWESAIEDLPFWFVAELGDDAVQIQNVFQSEHAVLAVLEDGRSVLRRNPRI